MHVGALRAHGFPRDKHPEGDPAPPPQDLPLSSKPDYFRKAQRRITLAEPTAITLPGLSTITLPGLSTITLPGPMRDHLARAVT